MASEKTDGAGLIHRLRQEIETLNAEQGAALKRATFLGMTPEEATIYDNRRSRITRLVRRLAELERVRGGRVT